MTTNPFGKLRVDHDDDEVTQTTVSKTEPSTQLFVQTEQKKKKKVRPEEKKKMEDEHDGDDGIISRNY